MVLKRNIFLSILILFTFQSRSQSILSLTETIPIVCYGDLASIELQINQTTPPTILKCIVGFNLFGNFVPLTSTNNTVVSIVNFPGLQPDTYTVRLVDSVLYYATSPNGSNPNSIYDEQQIIINGVDQLSVSTQHVSNNICSDDYNAVEEIVISGGTEPYSVTFNSITTNIGIGNNIFLTPGLPSGIYNFTVVDVNGCETSPVVSSFTIDTIPSIVNSVNITSCNSYYWNFVTLTNSGIYSDTTLTNFGCDSVSILDLTILQSSTSLEFANECDSFFWNGVNYITSGSYVYSTTNAVGCDSMSILNLTINNSSSYLDVLVGCDSLTWIDGQNYINSNNSSSVTLTNSVGCDSVVNLDLVILNSSDTILDVLSCSDYLFYGVIHNTSGTYTYNDTSTTGCDSTITLNLTIPQVNNGASNVSSCSSYNWNGQIIASSGSYNQSFTDVNGCDSIHTLNLIISSNIYSTDYILECDSHTWVNGVTYFSSNNTDSIIYVSSNGCDSIVYLDLTLNNTSSSSLTVSAMNSYTWFGTTYTSSGQYVHIVQYPGVCDTVFQLNLIIYPQIIISSSIQDEQCDGYSNGSIFNFVSGGSGSFSYQWSGPNNYSSNQLNIYNLSAGIYSLRLFDNITNDSIISTCVLNAGTMFLIDTIITDVSCSGNSDGSIEITNLNMNNPTYLWSDGVNTNNRYNLSAGSYLVEVSDNSNCVAIYTFVIDEPDPLFFINQQSSLVCEGTNNGVIEIDVYGGTMPYSYVWNNGCTSDVNTNLAPGIYYLSVLDQNSCYLQDSFEISHYYFDISGLTEDVSCNSFEDGSIDVSVLGGIPPFSYQWSNGFNTEDIVNLQPGIYSCVVTDTLGCVTDSSFTINEPQLLIAVSNTSDVSCYGGNDGKASLSIIGGIPPYNVDWGSVDTNNLYAGMFSYLITDDNSCIFTDSVFINHPDSLVVSINKIDVQCFGGNDGSIQLIVQQGSGTPPYSYSWSGPNQYTSNSEDLYNLIAGIYTLTIKDSNDCTKDIQVNINQPTPLNQYVNITTSNYSGFNITCKGSNTGQISVQSTGGYIPYNFLWSTGEVNDTINNLYAGIYDLIVIDGMGCESNFQINLVEPEEIVSGTIFSTNNYNGYDISCYGEEDGAIIVYANGGVPPYTYTWNNEETNDSIFYLESGYYEVFVKDNNNCLWIDSITLIQPDSFYVVIDTFPDTCSKGVGLSQVNSFGGVPSYIYSWSHSLDSLFVVDDLSEGVYFVKVNDQNQCEVSDSVFITNLNKPLTDFKVYNSPSRWMEQLTDPIVFVDITNGGWQEIIKWEWDFGDGIFGSDSVEFHSYDNIGIYNVILKVFTEYNCIDTVSKIVIVNGYDIFIPNTFTPNLEDNLNSVFKPIGYGIKEYNLKIYTRWGENIFYTNNIEEGWDGRYWNSQEDCPLGIYTYSIVLQDIYGAIHEYQGKINLIR